MGYPDVSEDEEDVRVAEVNVFNVQNVNKSNDVHFHLCYRYIANLVFKVLISVHSIDSQMESKMLICKKEENNELQK